MNKIRNISILYMSDKDILIIVKDVKDTANSVRDIVNGVMDLVRMFRR